MDRTSEVVLIEEVLPGWHIEIREVRENGRKVHAWRVFVRGEAAKGVLLLTSGQCTALHDARRTARRSLSRLGARLAAAAGGEK